MVRSDHKPLQYLFSLKDPTSKLSRIRLELSDYDLEIEHIKGKDNVAAHALSRLEFKDIRAIRNDKEHQLLVLTRARYKEQLQETQSSCGFREVLNNTTNKGIALLKFTFKEANPVSECWFTIKNSRIYKSKTLIYKPLNVKCYTITT